MGEIFKSAVSMSLDWSLYQQASDMMQLLSIVLTLLVWTHKADARLSQCKRTSSPIYEIAT